MKIVYDLRPLQTPSRTRGIGTVVRCALQALARLDSDNEYRLLRWSGPDPPSLDLPPGFRWSWLEVPRFFPRQAGWWYDRKILPGLLRGTADVAHFGNPFDLDMGWTVRRGGSPRPILFVYDMIPVRHWKESLRGKHRLLVPVFHRMAKDLSKAAMLLCISHSTADEVRALVDSAANVRVITLGIDAVFRPHSAEEVASFCQRHGLTAPFLLYVGGLNPNKNVKVMLQALPHLPQVATLVIVTSSHSAAAPLQRLIEELKLDGRVRWLTDLSVEDVAAAYSAARILVLPSLFEGFGLPVAEAMASGTAVVCSAIAALQEVGGDAVRTFDPTGAASVADAIAAVWDDDRARSQMREQGKVRAQAFTWDACARQLLDAYRSVLVTSS